jgi:hypothetical protein
MRLARAGLSKRRERVGRVQLAVFLIGSYAFIADCACNGFCAGRRGSPNERHRCRPDVHAAPCTRRVRATQARSHSHQRPRRTNSFRVRRDRLCIGDCSSSCKGTTSSLGTGIFHRIARAEYESVSNPTRLIPEHRIVDVWNQYVREIGAPDEAIVTAAEIHNMRDGGLTVAQIMWARGNQTVWTMPNVFALGPDGKVADGCRAVEVLRVIHDLDGLFQNLRSARDRLRKGIVPSDRFKKRVEDVNARPQTTARLVAHADNNPIRPAEQRYVQEHGSQAYQQLLRRLFDEPFPPD